MLLDVCLDARLQLATYSQTQQSSNKIDTYRINQLCLGIK
ncbi:hypothetical protein CRENPOLYSF2_2320004 [Crenothrix polyspora]|uniref:Uncharacterized protein n=1 Tax=Crenothrix polyspora TaxID=360316 RepID=A0A1R4H5V1_9GAMM|nr:hypothetical protein CRENPOLYSF2_2320004 [Crenothrix polyspora]